jgi:hypothetical protein
MDDLQALFDYAQSLPDPAARARLAAQFAPSQQQGGLGSINLANTAPPQRGGYAATPAQLLQQQNVQNNVNVPPSPGNPFGLNAPQTDEERGNVRQAGWSGAAAAVAPMMNDWRTTPAGALAAAVAGYGHGAYGAKQDVAAGRKDAIEANLLQVKAKALEDEQTRKDAGLAQAKEQIAKIAETDPERARNLGFLLQYDPSGLSDHLFPKPGESKVLQPGARLVGPDGKLIAEGGPETMSPAQAAQLGISQANLNLAQAKFKWDQQHPDGANGEPMVAVQGPDGPIYVPRSQAAGKTPAKTTDAGITMFDPATGNPMAQIGGDPQAVKLPQGFYFADPSEEAKAAGITSRVAAPIPGTPEYAKARGEVSAMETFREQLGRLGELYEKHGTSVLPSEAKGELESLQNALKLSYANAKGQGALQKTDDAVISSVLGAVTSPWSMLPGGNAQVTAQIKSAQGLVDQDLSSLQQKYPWQSIKNGGGAKPAPKEQFATMPSSGGPRAEGGSIIPPANAAPAPAPAAASPPAAKADDDKFFGFAP